MNELIDTLICVDKANKVLAESYAKSISINFCEVELGTKLSNKVVIEICSDKTSKDCVLIMDEEGLHLQMLYPVVFKIQVNFLSPKMEYRRANGGRYNQLIAKAVGVKPNVFPFVIDATAGLGKDAFILASLGCHVIMVERNPKVRLLLEDGLRRASYFAKKNKDLKIILERLKLLSGDAKDLFESQIVGKADVIYLDPMFPYPRKRALVKKDMQILQFLVGGDEDAERLLDMALLTKVDRVVVKRPKLVDAIGTKEASHVLKGKRNRYDIYLHCPNT